MAGNTEDTVRTAAVAAIAAIAVSALGFSGSGNVKSYLLSEEHKDFVAAYLMGSVGGVEYIRAIGVQVAAGEQSDNFHRLGTLREYAIIVEMYYGFVDSSPAQLMRQHARKIREVLFTTGKDLGGTVDRITAISPLEVDRSGQVSDVPHEVMIGRFIARAEEQNPGW